jgi:hypothetical protein
MDELNLSDWTYIPFKVVDGRDCAEVLEYYIWLSKTVSMEHWVAWKWEREFGFIVGIHIKEPEVAMLFKLRFSI